MSFDHEITRLRETANKDAVLALLVSIPHNGSMPTSGVYFGDFKDSHNRELCFSVNSTILDVACTPSQDFWCVDNEGHVYSNCALSDPPLEVDKEIDFTYTPTIAPQLKAYRFTHSPINTLWSDGTRTMFADETGQLWHIQNGTTTCHTVCPYPLAFFGSGSDDLYLYGRQGKLWHFNGMQWQEVQLPDIGLDYWAISGGVYLDCGEVMFVTSYGFVFKGSAQRGFTRFLAPRKQYSGITKCLGRYFVSAQDEGVFEILDIENSWQLNLLSEARLPMSLHVMGSQAPALYMTSAVKQGQPHFVVVEPAAKSDLKSRAYSWRINLE